MLLGLCSMMSYADSYHFYTNYGKNGELEKYESILGKYIVRIDNVTKSESKHVSCTITITLTEPVDEEDIEIYRCHADGTHQVDDEIDPVWNMKLQPSINPKWCDYSCITNDEGKVVKFTFTDTFHESLLKDENPNCNSLHYLIFDRHETTDHNIIIRIANILYYEVVTSIDEISVYTPVEYYDLQGRKLDGPQSGIVIEKQGSKVTKKMYH